MQEGSVFSIVRNNQKRFFQYIGKDSSQLYSDIIYFFEREYAINENPSVAEILNDSHEYVLHTTISLGKKLCRWQYVGKGKTQSIKDVVFATKHSNPLSFKIGEPLDGGWRIWKANEDAVIVPSRPNIKLTNGAVFSPYHIEEILFDTGFDDLYDVPATGEPKRMSVWFQQQEWNDIIEKDFLNKINLTYPELAPEYLFAQANLLLHSNKENHRNAGIRLLQIIIERYRSLSFHYTRACNTLASFFYENNDYPTAREYYSMIYEHNTINPRQQFNHLNTIFQIVRIIIATTTYADYLTAKKLLLTCKKEIAKHQSNELELKKIYNGLAIEINKQTDDKLTVFKNKWYENEDWNNTIEEEFFQKIANESEQSAILHIRHQATLLLDSDNTRLQTTAIRLFEHLFKNYSDSNRETALCHKILGNYYSKCKEYALSRCHYEKVRRYHIENKSDEMLLTPINLGIVASIIATHEINELQYAQMLLDELKQASFQKKEMEQFYALQNELNKFNTYSS